MAFLLPNLSPSVLLQSRTKEKPIHLTLAQTRPSNPISSFSLTSSLTSLQTPNKKDARVDSSRDSQDKQQRDDFYVNLGLAVRTLREDLPLTFTKELNYDIYR